MRLIKKRAPRAYADEPDVLAEVYDELGGVSVFFMDGEDRCLERRYWDLLNEDREDGPWFLSHRTLTAFKGLEPVIVIKDSYGRGPGPVWREQTDIPNGHEVTLSFRAKLDDGARVEARDRQDFVRELVALPTPADAEEKERRDVRREVGREAEYRAALLACATERGWPEERLRVLKRWLLGGMPSADLRWLMSQLGPELFVLVSGVVARLGPVAAPKRIADLMSVVPSRRRQRGPFRATFWKAGPSCSYRARRRSS